MRSAMAETAQIVADENDGKSELLLEGGDGFEELLLSEAVDAGGGLVEEQDFRSRRQCAGDQYAL